MRTAQKIYIDGVGNTVAGWAEMLGITPEAFRWRMKHHDKDYWLVGKYDCVDSECRRRGQELVPVGARVRDVKPLYNKRYYQYNKKRMAEYRKRLFEERGTYYQRNKEKMRAVQREYYWRNRDKILEKNRQRYAEG